MNKLYFLLLLALLGPAPLLAQTSDPTRAALDNLFAPLDKSQVPTRLLAEYAVPLVPLPAFNGTLADSNRTTPSVFRAIYATAVTACISGPNPLADLPAYNAQVAAVEATSETLIPIMGQ